MRVVREPGAVGANGAAMSVLTCRLCRCRAIYPCDPPKNCIVCGAAWSLDTCEVLARMFCAACGCHYAEAHTHDGPATQRSVR